MICEVCCKSRESTKTRKLDVVWKRAESSLTGAWSATLCAECVSAFIELMKNKGLMVSLNEPN